MSDPSAHDDHDSAPEPREITHPLLWTAGLVVMSGFLVWLFFHCMSVGAAEVRGEPKVSEEVKASGPPVDLGKLVHDDSSEVIAKGKAVFDGNCAACHGINGDTKGSTTPNARNFRNDAFKNPNGGGPYALYLVVTNGYNGAMPGFVGLHPDLRMAAVQYVREAFVKKYNAKNYVDADPPELEKSIPAPGSDNGGGPGIPPNQRPIPDTVPALLQDSAERAEADQARLAAWTAALPGASGPDDHGEIELLSSLVRDHAGLGVQLLEDAKAGDEKAFTALLTGGNLPGAPTSAFTVLPGARIEALFVVARNAAGGAP